MADQQIIHLWPEGSAHREDSAQQPTLTVYRPTGDSRQARPAVIVCPGGGYVNLAPHEGQPFAELFTRHGMVGFVLAYRRAPHRFPLPYADGCRAIRWVRRHAAELGVDPDRLGLMGFSAGGHLASTVACQPDLLHHPDDDLAPMVSARPNRLILGYPVISFIAHHHVGCVNNLLGPGAAVADRRRLSNECHVTAEHPPTFIFHTADDGGVLIENALKYAAALAAHNVNCELHAFAHGPHGVGLALQHPNLACWSDLLMRWLADWAR